MNNVQPFELTTDDRHDEPSWTHKWCDVMTIIKHVQQQQLRLLVFTDQDLSVPAEADFCISNAATSDYKPDVPGDFFTLGGDLDTWTAVVS